MDFVTALFIAVGLAMDAFAVSVASGFIISRLRIRHALRIAFFFGGFQALMPVAGWLAGLQVRAYIAGIDHWVALALLTIIGVRMIRESRRCGLECRKADPLKWPVLLMLSVATSIDALAVGITFALLETDIWMPVLIIGGVTFLFSFIGVILGDRFGHVFEKKIEMIGGFILIAIGIKIVIEHLITGQ